MMQLILAQFAVIVLVGVVFVATGFVCLRAADVRTSITVDKNVLKEAGGPGHAQSKVSDAGISGRNFAERARRAVFCGYDCRCFAHDCATSERDGKCGPCL